MLGFINRCETRNAFKLAILGWQVTVPFDNANPIGLTVSLTYGRDVVGSTTLKGFLKAAIYVSLTLLVEKILMRQKILLIIIASLY